MYRQGDCGGTQQVSMAIVCKWNADNGQTCGPAFEIEGNGTGQAGSGGSGGSGGLALPAAPLLLP
jgi:hypothetical protein